MAIIPESDLNMNGEIVEEEFNNKTYKIDFSSNKISGYIDEIEALKQTIYCILNTERYDYIIYSWNFGSELRNLIGKDVDFAVGDIRRRVTEALTQDDRIESIDNFKIQIEQDKMNLEFIVNSIYGEITIEKVVNING